MTGLILMLAVAGAMALFREPLGRGLVRLVEIADWKRAPMVVILLLLVWALLHHVQLVAGPVSGEGLATLFDASTYAALFDATTYADLAIGLAAAVLSGRTRQLAGRLIDLVRPAVHRTMQAARARRAAARPRRQPADRDEPEPAAFCGFLAIA
jgi:hypothetical protein